MMYAKISTLTGEMVKGWYQWLKKNQQGCCSICYASSDDYNYSVCIGWRDLGLRENEREGPWDDGWRIAWKIGRQTVNNIMQCDLDVDFDYPYPVNEYGDVYETGYVIEDSISDWDGLATEMRKAAQEVWDFCKDHEDWTEEDFRKEREEEEERKSKKRKSKKRKQEK